MTSKKKSFILYDGDIECVEHLTTKQAGLLLKAIVNLRVTGEAPDFGDDVALKILFHQITSHIAMNEEKYRQSCERNAKAARKRWQSKAMQKDAHASTRMQTDANECYNDNDNDNENVIDNDIDNVNENENDDVNENDNAHPASALISGRESEKTAKPNINSFYYFTQADKFREDALEKYRKLMAEGSSE